MEKIDHIDVKKGMSVKDLVKEMSGSGVMGAGKIAEASKILKEMKDSKKFFGFAGAMVPGGMKNIVIDMLKQGYIDVFVTTGANLTHDLIEALGGHHYKGCEFADDEELNDKGVDRIYNAFMKNEVYEEMEDFFKKYWEDFSKVENIKEFLWEIGRFLDKESILRVCYEKKIPIFCPAIADSGIGLMVWGNIAKGKKCGVKAFDDMKEIIDIAWTCDKSGVIYIGGGTPKNFIQQSLQFSKGADYGIQITTDRAEPGGSSGAPLKEGVSWGKMNKKARFVDVFCDATIALPLIWASIKDE